MFAFLLSGLCWEGGSEGVQGYFPFLLLTEVAGELQSWQGVTVQTQGALRGTAGLQLREGGYGAGGQMLGSLLSGKGGPCGSDHSNPPTPKDGGLTGLSSPCSGSVPGSVFQ